MIHSVETQISGVSTVGLVEHVPTFSLYCSLPFLYLLSLEVVATLCSDESLFHAGCFLLAV